MSVSPSTTRSAFCLAASAISGSYMRQLSIADFPPRGCKCTAASRTIRAGETCGYGATFTAREDTEAAILNIGYADGYLRGFSSRGSAFAGEYALPVLGRVSMDLIAVGVAAAPGLKEGDWVEIDYDLPGASKQSGLSQYELLTTLGSRFERRWI